MAPLDRKVRMIEFVLKWNSFCPDSSICACERIEVTCSTIESTFPNPGFG